MIVLFENITNPSSGNIFLFYLHHFHPQPHPQPLTSPPAGFSDLHGGVCKRRGGGGAGGGHKSCLFIQLFRERLSENICTRQS